MSPEFWKVVIGLLTATGVILGALQGYKTIAATREQTKSNKEIENSKLEIEGVKVGMDSIKQSNAELRLDNVQLRADLAGEREAVRLLDEKFNRLVSEFAEHKRFCRRLIQVLESQVIALGGTPSTGDGK